MTRHLLSLLAAALAMPLAAQPLPDYEAVYRILPLNSDTPIGEYRVSQRWQPQRSLYLQQASIAFSWRVLLSQHHYQYRDEVLYAPDNSLSYTISENNDGKKREIRGSMPAHAQALTLSVTEGEGKKSAQAIDKANFDYTLFALRFPVACSAKLAGTRRSARMLIPASGEVDTGLSHYVGMVSLRLPGVATPFTDLCLIETGSKNKEVNRRSWFNRQGYLVYEIAANYRLLLIPEDSHLPPNHQEKP